MHNKLTVIHPKLLKATSPTRAAHNSLHFPCNQPLFAGKETKVANKSRTSPVWSEIRQRAGNARLFDQRGLLNFPSFVCAKSFHRGLVTRVKRPWKISSAGEMFQTFLDIRYSRESMMSAFSPACNWNNWAWGVLFWYRRKLKWCEIFKGKKIFLWGNWGQFGGL